MQNEFGEKARLGDDAHIIASSDYGPRGNEEIGQQQRRSADNLILLCKTCHSEIDQQQKKFDEEALLRLREEHYSWVEERLGSKVTKPRFHYLSYINIPRADMYASAQSIALPNFNLNGAETIRQLGINAGRLMAQYTSVLNVEELYSNVLTDGTSISEISEGDYWFVSEALFRTKRIGGYENLPDAWRDGESVIYRDLGSWRLICLIDPRWITTTTTLVEFQRGSYKLAGLLHISRVEPEKGRVIASPLFLGSPDNDASR
ncbi:HNH endonuclease [Sinorhizobium fredii]|uniref:HNH endonuclease n=1 Tax=Rhizobium fredii TaxID=380 RepID=UPI0012FD1349|nr:HNH endonuclease [Sinorhizobium fredii]